MPLISVILFAFAVLIMGVRQEQLEVTQAQGTALQQMTAQSAKEFSEFTKAAAAYIQSVGLPLPGTALTVGNLQGVNLLPSSFPTQTPFGQTLVADYVSDPNNPVALDVVVHTTGSMNAALLQKAGVSSGSLATVQYDTAVVAQNQVPSSISGSTGQFFGVANGAVLDNLGSSSSMTLPGGISTQQQEVAEYILSPGQYGYWLISANAFSSPFQVENPVNATSGIFSLRDFILFGNNTQTIQSQGFSLTCPSIAQNMTNYTPGGINGADVNVSNSMSLFFCIPAYKGQVVPFTETPATQFLGSTSISQNLSWNGQYYVYASPGYSETSNASYVNTGSIAGLNNNLYVTGGFVSNAGGTIPQYPNNEAFPVPNTNAIGGDGVLISVKTPQNTTDNYQIEIDAGILFTGPGCSEVLFNPDSGQSQLYQVWANSSGTNLCGSQVNQWQHWSAVKDSSNTSSIPVSQTYEYGGNSYPLGFSVATPMVN